MCTIQVVGNVSSVAAHRLTMTMAVVAVRVGVWRGVSVVHGKPVLDGMLSKNKKQQQKFYFSPSLAGLEPATFGFGFQRAIQLCHKDPMVRWGWLYLFKYTIDNSGTIKHYRDRRLITIGCPKTKWIHGFSMCIWC